jgi:hypothetical protein
VTGTFSYDRQWLPDDADILQTNDVPTQPRWKSSAMLYDGRFPFSSRKVIDLADPSVVSDSLRTVLELRKTQALEAAFTARRAAPGLASGRGFPGTQMQCRSVAPATDGDLGPASDAACD